MNNYDVCEWKEVWYPWNGEGKLPEEATRLKLSNSWYIDSNDKMVNQILEEEFHAVVVAYTIGQMRRKVYCPVCMGRGDEVIFESRNKSLIKHTVSCMKCRGRGYHWKTKEK